MKLIAFAIASIVDANTGNGLVHGAGEPVSRSPQRSRRAAGSSATRLAERIGGAAGSIHRWFAAAVGNRRRVRELAALSDHLLRDIGLHRGDVEALALGRLDFDELDRVRRQRAERRGPRGVARPVVGTLRLPSRAANDSRRQPARCA